MQGPIRADSLTQFVARRAARLAGSLVAVSVSEADDPAAHGLSPLHQRDLVVALARHLFAVGARLAYGGDFRKAGFAELLVEVARAHVRFAQPTAPQIASYVPEARSTEERASYVDVVSFVEFAPPPDDGDPSPARGRARRLRAMRRRVATDAIALIAVGGRTSGFAGWRPGIAVEDRDRGRGGSARLSGRRFRRRCRRVRAICVSSRPDPHVRGRGGPGKRAERHALAAGGRRGSARAFAETVDTDEIVQLVLTGLSTLARPRRARAS